MALLIGLLGPLVIEIGDRRLGKVPRKARALLAYLAAQGGRPVSRERLSDLLWPYQGSDQARHSLRNCLLELRKALGPGAKRHLVAEFANCRLQDIELDGERFERLARSSNRVELAVAAELYRGEFLSDFVIDSEPFQEWLAAERDRTLDLICGVLQRLTVLQDEAGGARGGHSIGAPSGRARSAVGDWSAGADPRLCACRQATGGTAAVPHLRRNSEARARRGPRRAKPRRSRMRSRARAALASRLSASCRIGRNRRPAG